MTLKILTFNHHESFLAAIAKTGFEFDVVEQKGSLDLSWNPASPPRPHNMKPVVFDQDLKSKLSNGYYDVVLCHTIKNLIWMMPYKKCRYIFVAHIHLFQKSISEKLKAFIKKSIFRKFSSGHSCKLVAVTRNKVHSWNVGGDVIVNVPSNIASGQTESENSEDLSSPLVHPVIFVSNQMKLRGDEAGYKVIKYLSSKIPLTVIGNNPDFPGAVIPDTYETFQRCFRKGLVYVFPVQPPYDEFNLAMLEAMRLGLPVVCFQHPLSPIIHNVNGLVANSMDQMLRQLTFLVNNPGERARLGDAAKVTIAEHFSESAFIENWSKTIREQ